LAAIRSLTADVAPRPAHVGQRTDPAGDRFNFLALVDQELFHEARDFVDGHHHDPSRDRSNDSRRSESGRLSGWNTDLYLET
jgi:hypothetical protein